MSTKGPVGHSVQTELVVRDYEGHCASTLSDGISDQFDENVHVDVTMMAVKYSIEPPSIPAQSAVAPVSYVAVRVENNEAAVKNRRDATFLPPQIAQNQETQEIA
jgi:hypothetical protein